MTALTRNKPRAVQTDNSNALPLAAAAVVYEGAAVGIRSTDGYARSLVSGDGFAGFAVAKVDNSKGAAGSVSVRLLTKGEVELVVTGAVVTSVGQSVYATDDDTFSVSVVVGSLIGVIKRVSSAGLAVVAFDALLPVLTATQVAAVVTEQARASRGGSLLRQGRPWMRNPTDAAIFTAGGGTTKQIVTRNGRLALELTVPASASLLSCWFAVTPGGAGTISQQQHVTFEVEDASEWNGGSWRIGFYTANDAANGVRYSQTVGTSNGWDGMHCFAPLSTEWANVGTGSFASVITHCFFFFQRKAAPTGTTRIWIYEIVEAERNSLPAIVISADDGHTTWYTDGLPLAEKYGLPVSMAFIADDRGTATRMSAAQWYDAIVTRGHTAVVHGCKSGISSLRDYFAAYAPYINPAAAIYADITYNRDAMVAEGLDPDGRGRHFYVLPAGYHQPSGGAGDDTIVGACITAGMTAMRRATVENAIICNGAGHGAAMYLPIIGHSYAGGSEAANIAAIVTQMQTEIAAGRSVILMFHEVRAGPTLPEHITAANLETLLAAVATLIRAGSARAGRLTDLASELLSYTSPVHLGQ